MRRGGWLLLGTFLLEVGALYGLDRSGLWRPRGVASAAIGPALTLFNVVLVRPYCIRLAGAIADRSR